MAGRAQHHIPTHRGQSAVQSLRAALTNLIPGNTGHDTLGSTTLAQGSPVGEKRSEVTLISGLK